MTATGIKRFAPRFSLRTLVVFLLLVTSGVGLWWRWEAWWLVQHLSEVEYIAFTPDGGRIVLGCSGQKTKAMDLDCSRTFAEFEGTPTPFYHVQMPLFTLSADGQMVLTVSEDGRAFVWRIDSGERLAELDLSPEKVRGACFSPEGTRVAAFSSEGTVVVRNLRDGRELSVRHPRPEKPIYVRGSLGFVQFSPGGSSFVTAREDDSARLWDAKTGEKLFDFEGMFSSRQGCCGVFSPDGDRIVIAGESAMLHDARTGKLVRKLASGLHDGDVVCYVSFSPNGRFILTSFEALSPVIWESATGALLTELEEESGMTDSGDAVLSPDGSLVAVGSAWRATTEGGGTSIRDAKTGKCLHRMEEHGGRVLVAFSPDGRRLVTAGGGLWKGYRVVQEASGKVHVPISVEGAVIVWDVLSGARLALAGTHAEQLSSVAFSPDGDRLITHGYDKTARIWKRRRPEWWWGVFWLWEFWLTVAFAALFIWSVLRDRRSLAPTG